MKAHNDTIFPPRAWLAGKVHLTPPALALALLIGAGLTRADEEHRRHRMPDLPSPACDSVDVPAGNRVSSHFYALGVQIYRWDGMSWVFVGPEAKLFADPCYEEPVGLHYAGPTWEANDGSKVMGAVQTRCTPFRGAIPWLRLEAHSLSDHGRFSRLTYIQRVNTIGGTAPAEAGAFVGDEARVPYTAEYFFYRKARE